MRNQWRLLFQRCKPVSELHFKVQSSTTVPLSHHRTFYSRIPQSGAPQIRFQNPSFPRLFTSSSELAVEQNKVSDQSVITSALIELYSDPVKSNEDVMLELRSKKDLASDYVNELFNNRGSEPGAAKIFFDWVMSKEGDNLSSNSCNRMLGMLGANGLVKEFWDLVEIMKKKGYGVKKGASVRAMSKFEEEGMEGDVQKLKGLFALGSVDDSVEKASSRVCKVIRQVPWGDDVETKLQEMGVVFSGDLVKAVLENLGTEPNKAVIFFRWIEESGLYKHDEKTYNAIARELAREDYMDKFWRLIDEMRTAGYDLEKATYIRVLNQFVRKKMLKDAVDLYEFAMGGNIKPSVQDCPFLLRKIVTSNELDMDLFSKVLRIYKESGNTLTNTALDAVLKSLMSVGRYGECNKILRAMEEVGFLIGEKLQGKIAFQLSKDSKTEEASEFLDLMEASGTAPSYKTWGSLIEGYCLSGHLDKACDCFQKMIEKEGSSGAGYALEMLISAFCSKERAAEAYKLLSEVVIGKGVEPWHTTYKLLISKLLDNGLFKEATNLLPPMKNHGYPPFLDPFVKSVAKTGTTEDTLMFLKAMTVKRSPSTAVYMRVFKAYFKAGRHSQAQDLLSKCPRYIRSHVEVLNLFSSMKCVKENAASTPVAA
ncbi:pentatricopeptide repeat-containing protein At3g02490, mitochondrial-like [Cynara cardunculus var. scolymus]|uniref:Pentatricopeptide repeat-containing protein n=1 Tax=Cynara cardunculus var. scolymus TaxID=59895 RepID=A0A118JUU4_CYNCS|nr:pentatricopeptide repeat-containing protein At3g02490, mitochondrial-like [Cynara cardunculus var. scolymus]KVH92604.1 Pentatricopeptide repeat-containing protein [Cynara cardunculus var. scolymus]